MNGDAASKPGGKPDREISAFVQVKRSFERRFFRTTRFFTLAAVIATLAGAALMFWLGLTNTWRAFSLHFDPPSDVDELTALPKDEATIVILMDALDRFLIGMVLLFFAYGVYGLFIRPGLKARDIGLPAWLQVERIGQLKQTLAEVIIVVLFVLFLRVAFQTFHAAEVAMTAEAIGRFLLLPVAIVLLALALRLVQLHPKEKDPPELEKIERSMDESEAKAKAAAEGGKLDEPVTGAEIEEALPPEERRSDPDAETPARAEAAPERG